MDAEIKGLVLKVGDRDVVFTEEEARAVYAKLHEIFGGTAVPVIIREYPPPTYVPIYPQPVFQPLWNPTITCGVVGAIGAG